MSMRLRPRIWLPLTGLILLSLSSSAIAQAPGEEKTVPIGFWKTTPGAETGAAAAFLSSVNVIGGPSFGLVAARKLLAHEKLLEESLWAFGRVVSLDARDLKRIRDDRPLPEVTLELTDSAGVTPDHAWYRVFNLALVYTRVTRTEEFENSARATEGIVYSHLRAQAPLYRGKIVTVKGNLKVLKKEASPRLIPARFKELKDKHDHDMNHIYIGWIVTESPGAPPFVVALSELPDAIVEEKDKLNFEKLNLDVTFLGYFLSHVRFRDTPRPGKSLDSPYLVGKLVSVQPGRKEVAGTETGGVTYFYVVATLGGMILVALLVVSLNVWLRRGDERVRSQLAEVRERHNPFSIEPAEPPTAQPVPQTETKEPPPQKNEP